MKLTDFGLSRTLTDRRDSKLSIEGGSAAWSPPEVIIENAYSEKSDVWSYGVLLWEIFSCRLPYKDYDNIYILYSVAYREKTPSMPSDCPPALADVFIACWMQKSAERVDFEGLLQLLDTAEMVLASMEFRWVREGSGGFKSWIFRNFGIFQKPLQSPSIWNPVGSNHPRYAHEAY